MTYFKIDMPVISHPNHFYDRVLLSSDCADREQTKIISFSQKIATIDPLLVLAEFACDEQLHFYWENPNQEEALVAIGSAWDYTTESALRFKKSQNFMLECLKHTQCIGDLHYQGAGPHLFCSFSFFNEHNQNYPFPGATIFLPSWQITKKKNEYILIVNQRVNENSNVQEKLQEIKEKLKIINYLKLTKKNEIKIIKNHHQNFTEGVKKALKTIQQKKVKKIVLAHAVDLVAEKKIDIIEALDKLRKYHKDCYIFCIGNKEGDNFIGASPERLLSIENNYLHTDALAGSASRGKTAREDEEIAIALLTSEKEKREHQAVSEYILQRLRELGLQAQREPLQLLKLSNIQHLWTPIRAVLKTELHPLEIVAQLHPTPAVAGVPTEFACEKIRDYESFERGLYAAPLGWIDYQGNAKFIVGIRSALIKGNQARLYAGAGIVEGSDPEKEFAEVQLKLQSLLKVLY